MSNEFFVILFLSVDLVNSTKFKQSAPSNYWPPFFKKFFTSFPESFQANLGNHWDSTKQRLRIWKILGDEIIFRYIVNNEEDIFTICNAFNKSLESYYDKLEKQKSSNNSTTSLMPLSVKGVGWLAGFPYRNHCFNKSTLRSIEKKDFNFVSNINEKDNNFRKKIIKSLSQDNYNNDSMNEESIKSIYMKQSFILDDFDYLGPEIDIGFRLSKITQSKRFVISYELAEVLSKRVKDNVFFVGYEKMKGVWMDDPYPIFWYIDKKSRLSNVNFEEKIKSHHSLYHINSNNIEVSKVMSELRKEYKKEHIHSIWIPSKRKKPPQWLLTLKEMYENNKLD